MKTYNKVERREWGYQPTKYSNAEERTERNTTQKKLNH